MMEHRDFLNSIAAAVAATLSVSETVIGSPLEPGGFEPWLWPGG
ncbi:MAG: hypothetical protein ACP5I8_13520 [Phycisphaerae bacterium]